MDRSFAGRLGIGGVSPRSSRAARPRPKRGGRPRAARETALDRAIALLWRAPATVVGVLARGWSVVRVHRRVRIALIVAAVLAPLLVGGWLWLRNSSLVAVSDVRVAGVHGADARAIDAALTDAARRMTTLNVSAGELRSAVSGYPIVGAIEVHASFPHSLRIDVVEQPPVASVTVEGAKTAVAADGVVLGLADASGALPSLKGTTPLSTGERVHNPTLLAALAALGAAPARLAHEVQTAYGGPKGLTIVLHGGVLAYFGDATRAHAKWMSLARVLADPTSAGASYVDVRVPERPAAGFPAGVALPSGEGAEAQGEGSTASRQPLAESSQALAEGLSSAVGGSASTSSTSEPEEASASGKEASPEVESSASSTGESSEAGSGEGH